MSSAVPWVVVIGEAMVDAFETHSVVGGAPFNVARSLSALGLRVLMVTRIGDDAAGALVQRSAARYGLSPAGVQVDVTLPTGRVLVQRVGSDHRFTILRDQAWDHVDAAQALAAIRGLDIGALYCGTLAQRQPGTRAAVRALLGTVQAPHFVDLNLRAGEVEVPVIAQTLHFAQTVKANTEELRELIAWFVHPALQHSPWDSADMHGAVQQLMAQFGLDRLLVTRGDAGAACFHADGSCSAATAAAAPRSWGDAVGAGDAFSAIYLAGSLLGWPLATTLERANSFAAAICGIAGAVPDDPAFYAPWRRAWGLATP